MMVDAATQQAHEDHLVTSHGHVRQRQYDVEVALVARVPINHDAGLFAGSLGGRRHAIKVAHQDVRHEACVQHHVGAAIDSNQEVTRTPLAREQTGRSQRQDEQSAWHKRPPRAGRKTLCAPFKSGGRAERAMQRRVSAAALALLLCVSLAGCTLGDPAARPDEPRFVDPPASGGEWLPCHGEQARSLAVNFRAEPLRDAGGLAPGIHADNVSDEAPHGAWTWVWAHYEDTARDDRVTRVNEVSVARETDDTLGLCTRVDLATPLEVDADNASYDVAVRLTALDPLPPHERLQVIVNWIAGCNPCPEPARGHDARLFAS